MPARRKNRSQKPKGKDRIERVSGRVVFSANPAATAQVMNISVSPGFPYQFITGTGTVNSWGFEKLSIMSRLFKYYRCVKLVHRWLSIIAPTANNTSGTMALFGTYQGGEEPTIDQPQNSDQVLNMPNQFKTQTVQYYSGNNVSAAAFMPSVPKNNVMGRALLAGRQPFKWWVCETDIATAAVPGSMVYQGNLFFADQLLSQSGASAYSSVGYAFELDYVFEFCEFQHAPTAPSIFRGGLNKKHELSEECEEKSDDDESELDDASLMIIANQSTGLGIGSKKRSVNSATGLRASALKAALEQARRDEMVARSSVHRLETKLKEAGASSEVIITPA